MRCGQVLSPTKRERERVWTENQSSRSGILKYDWGEKVCFFRLKVLYTGASTFVSWAPNHQLI